MTWVGHTRDPIAPSFDGTIRTLVLARDEN
jgi:hypothetical protein